MPIGDATAMKWSEPIGISQRTSIAQAMIDSPRCAEGGPSGGAGIRSLLRRFDQARERPGSLDRKRSLRRRACPGPRPIALSEWCDRRRNALRIGGLRPDEDRPASRDEVALELNDYLILDTAVDRLGPWRLLVNPRAGQTPPTLRAHYSQSCVNWTAQPFCDGSRHQSSPSSKAAAAIPSRNPSGTTVNSLRP